MYEELVSHLRECSKIDPVENTYKAAADAIEELNRRIGRAIELYNRNVEKSAMYEALAGISPEPPKGGNMNGCEYCGYANRTAGKTLHIVEETEPRIFINMHGSGYIQIFDEEYPGFVDGFYVNYCPMCGARLRSGYVGGEPLKEQT